jgi:hypothetical protein
VRLLRAVAGVAVAAAGAGLGCRENVTAPGSCPGICPSGQIRVVDTTLTGIVLYDTSYVGYVVPSEAGFLIVSNGDSLSAVALIQFAVRANSWYPSGSDTSVGIGSVDSVALSVTVTSRDTLAHNVWLLAYRLPALFDTSVTRADVQPYLADSLLVDSIPVPDTLTAGLVTKAIATRVLDSIPEDDSGVVSLALVAHGSAPVTLSLSALEQITGSARLNWYVRAPAPLDTVTTTISVGPQFDSFVYVPPTASPAASLLAGGLPSARSILRLQLPPEAIDSVGLVRATLILTPTGPAQGLPGENFRVSARGIIRDFGAKSVIFSDTSAGGTAPVVTGDSGEIRIEIGRLLREWGTAAGDSLPRALMLVGVPEGGGLGTVALARGTAGAAAPRLRITYVRPYQFGVP